MRRVLVLAVLLIILVIGSILMYQVYSDPENENEKTVKMSSILDPMIISTSIREDHEVYTFSIELEWSINGTIEFLEYDEIILNTTLWNSEDEGIISFNRSLGSLEINDESYPYNISKKFNFTYQGWDYINEVDPGILDSDHYLITTITSGDDLRKDVQTFRMDSMIDLDVGYERNGSYVDLFWKAKNNRDYELKVTYPTNSPFYVEILDMEGNYVRTVYYGMLQAFFDDTWKIGEERYYRVTWRGVSWNDSQPVDDGTYIMYCKFNGNGYTEKIEIELIRD